MDPIKDEGATNDASTQTEGVATGEATERTYTQAEIDRRVTDALKKAEEKQAAALKAERERLEAEKLREQGEFKTLHEKSQAELDALRKTLEAKEQREAVSAALRDAGLGEFEGILLSERTKPEDYVECGKGLRETINKLVDAEVAKRLDTGQKSTVVSSSQQSPQGILYPSMQKVG